MSFTDYLLNGALVALVVLQIRGRRLSVRTMAFPLAVVGVVAAEFVHSIPGGSGNLTLVAVGAVTGALLGTACGLTTSVFRGSDGRPWAKAGVAAAVLWVLGVGARLAFALYATHGGQAAIGRFSVAHHITSGDAWVDCLVLMALAEVLARSAVLGLRYWRLSVSPEAGSASATAAPATHAIIEPSAADWS